MSSHNILEPNKKSMQSKMQKIQKFNTALVAQVRKHPCLWENNTRKPFIAKRSSILNAWKEIATVLHTTVPQCRNSWKGVRDAFGRYVKEGKHTYYLQDDLEFLIPHLRVTKQPETNTRAKEGAPSVIIEETQNQFREINVRLAREIKKYPCLYDKTLGSDVKPVHREAAWIEVSQKLKIPMTELKKRWKNMRTVYLKYYKVKEYYLSEELSFIRSADSSPEQFICEDDNSDDFNSEFFHENNSDEIKIIKELKEDPGPLRLFTESENMKTEEAQTEECQQSNNFSLIKTENWEIQPKKFHTFTSETVMKEPPNHYSLSPESVKEEPQMDYSLATESIKTEPNMADTFTTEEFKIEPETIDLEELEPDTIDLEEIEPVTIDSEECSAESESHYFYNSTYAVPGSSSRMLEDDCVAQNDQADYLSVTDDLRKMFLLSLLPDVRLMNEKQFRKFKVQVNEVIYVILEEGMHKIKYQSN